MRTFIFFDNSGLTRLFEENGDDREALLAGLRTLGELRLSALNVYETAKTPDRQLRLDKLRFYARVASGVPPLADPMAVLERLARNWCDGTAPEIVVDELAGMFVREPDVIPEEFQHDFSAWTRHQEQDFADSHIQLRSGFDTAYQEVQVRLRNESQFLEMAFSRPDLMIHGLIAGPFQMWTGEELEPHEVEKLLDDVAPWKTFAAAQLHVLWLRSAAETIVSPKRTGIFDTDSAVYLPYCDYFVTSDHAQLATMKVANSVNPRNSKVELYTALRSRLLL